MAWSWLSITSFIIPLADASALCSLFGLLRFFFDVGVPADDMPWVFRLEVGWAVSVAIALPVLLTGVSGMAGLLGLLTGISEMTGVSGLLTGVSGMAGVSGLLTGVSWMAGVSGLLTGVSGMDAGVSGLLDDGSPLSRGLAAAESSKCTGVTPALPPRTLSNSAK